MVGMLVTCAATALFIVPNILLHVTIERKEVAHEKGASSFTGDDDSLVAMSTAASIS